MEGDRGAFRAGDRRNRGIGLAIARRLAADGDSVTVTSRSGEPVDGLSVVQCDVRDAASVDAAFTAIEQDQGPVEVLVANAGITQDQLLALMKEDAFTDVLDTNLTGAYRVAKRAVRGMMKMRRGRMIFISSVVGLYGSGGQANYAASKAGLVGLARSLARELGSRGITANVVAPGFVDSDMTAVLSEERKAQIIGAVPLGRYASADEVAGAVAFLAGPGRRLRHRRGHPGRRRPRHGSLRRTTMGILDGKRILVTGVLTDASIAFHVARVAQEQGATLVLTAFPRPTLVERIAKRLPQPAPVIELDVTSTEQLDALKDRVKEHVDGLDGVVHSIGNAPQSRARRQLPHHPVGGRGEGRARLDLLAEVTRDGGAAADGRTAAAWSASTSTRPSPGPAMTGWAWPRPGSSPAPATWPATSARSKVRVNLVAAGPLKTMAAKSIPGFEKFEDVWSQRAPLGWDIANPEAAARACVALLSDWFPATTGEIVHVDGGVHAVGV